ncbi:hypothetical protein RFI_36003, partial [Reticulomyxa filosa]
LLVIHLLERVKNKNKWYVDTLSKISEDMWKYATIDRLKENIQMKNENTLMNKEKWNNSSIDRDVEYPCLNDEIEEISNDENAFKGCYTVVHEAAMSGDLSQFKLVLQNHPDIDINDSYNEHRQTPLHLAINNQHWDIARYCIKQGVYIDIRGGVLSIFLF